MFRIVYVLLFVSCGAFAAPTLFEQTQSKFDQGRVPTAQELLGWNVGRCFYSQYGDPDTAYAGIAFGVDHATGHAPGDLKILIGPAHDYAKPADQFDSPSEEVKGQLQDMVVDPYYDQLTKAELKTVTCTQNWLPAIETIAFAFCRFIGY